jgi:hypothetical protein
VGYFFANHFMLFQKNIFEFTAGRGAHAGRQQRNNPAAPAPAPNANKQPNGVDKRSRGGTAAAAVRNPNDSQLQDIIY